MVGGEAEQESAGESADQAGGDQREHSAVGRREVAAIAPHAAQRSEPDRDHGEGRGLCPRLLQRSVSKVRCFLPSRVSS